jgi:hypothetical protein
VGLAVTHLRGGAWNNNQMNARAVYRNNNHPGNRNNNIGFRVVVVSPTPLVPLPGLGARAAGESFPFDQGVTVSSIAGRVRFTSRGEELKEGAAVSRPHGRWRTVGPISNKP